MIDFFFSFLFVFFFVKCQQEWFDESKKQEQHRIEGIECKATFLLRLVLCVIYVCVRACVCVY